MTDRKDELGSAPIRQLLIKYSAPAIVAMFVSSMYNLVDTIFVGHGAGLLALAALAVSWPVQMVVVAVGMAVGIGAASVVSRNLGAGDQDRAERAAGTSFAVIGATGIAMTVGGLVVLRPLLRLFGATDAVMPFAVDYMSVIFLGNFFLACSICANNIARSEGAARVAMVSMIIGAVLNVVLDPIFIFGLDMGIRGAAIATVIANICTFVFLCWYFLSGRSMLKLRRRHLVPTLAVLPEIILIGSSTFFSMVAGSLMAIPINGLIIRYGADIHLAVIGVGNRSMMFFFLPIFGLTQGLQPIIGFNFGARKLARVREAVRKATIYASVMSVGAFLVVMLGTRPVLRMFSSEAELIETGIPIIRILAIGMPFVGFQMVGGAMFQALGRARPAFVLTLSRQVFVLLPLIFLMPQFYGLMGLWVSFPIADVLAMGMTGAWVWVAVRGLVDMPSESAPVVNEEVVAEV